MRPFAYALALLLVCNCANPITPTGGPKDIKPPQVLSVNIQNHSTSIKPHTITYTFDENIQITNPNDEIVLSPRYGHPLNIKTGKRFISISLDTNKLYDNTTYNLSLNKAISDLNESNKGEYKSLLFSTGTILDTQQLYATYSYIGTQPIKKIKAIASDSIISKPEFIGSISNNQILFQGVNTNKKNIVIFDDVNGNDTADKYESKGFTLSKYGDTSRITLYPCNLIPVTVKIIDSTSYKVYGFSSAFRELAITPLLNDKEYFFNDTLYCSGSTLQKLKSIPETKLYQIPTRADNSSTYGKVNFKLISIRKDSFLYLKYDSDRAIPNTTFINSSGAEIKPHKKTTNQYIIRLNANRNDIIKTNFKDSFIVKNITQNLISLSNPNKTTVIISIKNSAFNEEKIYSIKPGENIELYLLKGDYLLTYWKDLNNDFHITPPDILSKQAGEDITYHKSIKINGSIEFHMKLDFNK
jgi:hypothetical protein